MKSVVFNWTICSGWTSLKLGALGADLSEARFSICHGSSSPKGIVAMKFAMATRNLMSTWYIKWDEYKPGRVSYSIGQFLEAKIDWSTTAPLLPAHDVTRAMAKSRLPAVGRAYGRRLLWLVFHSNVLLGCTFHISVSIIHPMLVVFAENYK